MRGVHKLQLGYVACIVLLALPTRGQEHVATASSSPEVAAAAPAQQRSVAAKPQPAWVFANEKDGIKSWKREVPGSNVIALHGEGVVAAPIAKVVSVLLDHTRAPEWVDSLELVKLIRKIGPAEFIEYNRIGTPPLIMKDRDFVCRVKMTFDAKAQTFLMTMDPAVDRAMPETDCVRGELHGFWKFRALDNGRKTFVATEMHGDPKGSVPKFLVNWFQSGWAHSTLKSLREQVAKKDVKIKPWVQAAFEGKPYTIDASHAPNR